MVLSSLHMSTKCENGTSFFCSSVQEILNNQSKIAFLKNFIQQLCAWHFCMIVKTLPRLHNYMWPQLFLLPITSRPLHGHKQNTPTRHTWQTRLITHCQCYLSVLQCNILTLCGALIWDNQCKAIFCVVWDWAMCLMLKEKQKQNKKETIMRAKYFHYISKPWPPAQLKCMELEEPHSVLGD